MTTSHFRNEPYIKSQDIDKISSYPLKEDVKILSLTEHELNIKERQVYCKKCKYRALTSLAGPICHTCNENLITVSRMDLID